MQTFLPFSAFSACAQVLDVRRLGRQRVEALQILRALSRPGYGWQHHPAVGMWAGYEEALTRYGLEMCSVLSAAGREDTCAVKLKADFAHALGTPCGRAQDSLACARELPPWLGDAAFHRSHQSALLRKDPDHYSRWFAEVPADLPYIWPASDRSRARK